MGTPMAIGLVDMRRSVPPKGATSMPRPLVLTKWMEIRPRAAASSAQSPMRPRWPELRRPTTAMPCSRAFSTASPTACSPMVWPKPWSPSSTATAPASTTVFTRRPACTVPDWSQWT